MRPSKCFATDGSQIQNKPSVGFASIDVSYRISWKFRIAKIVSTFTAEALEIGKTKELVEEIGSEKNFVIFSDSESVLKGVSDIPTMNNTSHNIQMLKEKIG
jgi:hypothetical protein